MPTRTISVNGTCSNVAKGVDIIYDLLGERSNIVRETEKYSKEATYD